MFIMIPWRNIGNVVNSAKNIEIGRGANNAKNKVKILRTECERE